MTASLNLAARPPALRLWRASGDWVSSPIPEPEVESGWPRGQLAQIRHPERATLCFHLTKQPRHQGSRSTLTPTRYGRKRGACHDELMNYSTGGKLVGIFDHTDQGFS